MTNTTQRLFYRADVKFRLHQPMFHIIYTSKKTNQHHTTTILPSRAEIQTSPANVPFSILLLKDDQHHTTTIPPSRREIQTSPANVPFSILVPTSHNHCFTESTWNINLICRCTIIYIYTVCVGKGLDRFMRAHPSLCIERKKVTLFLFFFFLF